MQRMENKEKRGGKLYVKAYGATARICEEAGIPFVVRPAADVWEWATNNYDSTRWIPLSVYMLIKGYVMRAGREAEARGIKFHEGIQESVESREGGIVSWLKNESFDPAIEAEKAMMLLECENTIPLGTAPEYLLQREDGI